MSAHPRSGLDLGSEFQELHEATLVAPTSRPGPLSSHDTLAVDTPNAAAGRLGDVRPLPAPPSSEKHARESAAEQPIYSPKPIKATASTSPAKPSPLSQALSPPPPLYQEQPRGGSIPGPSNHPQYPSSSTQSNSSDAHRRRRGTVDDGYEMDPLNRKPARTFSSKEEEAFAGSHQQYSSDPDPVGWGVSSAHSHESHAPLNRFGTTADEDHPGRILITLTTEIPYRPELEAGPRAGFVLSNQRKRGLEEVDAAHFSFFHMKVCMIAGVGFFTDAYDIFAINIAFAMINFVFNGGIEPAGSLGAAVKAAAPVGTLIGQLLFGWLADVAGRKRMYGVELIIIIIGTFGQALSTNAQSSLGTINIYAVLIVWRFVMGLGIGGDYPLSAVISSEFASSHIRGRMMTAVFANQGWGQFTASVVGCLILVAFKRSFGDLDPFTVTGQDTDHLMRDIDRAWRILLGLGCIPATLALYFRLTIPETPRFTMDIERNVQQATQDIEDFLMTGKYKYNPDSIVIRVIAPKASWSDFFRYFGRWENAKVLLGCAYAWFAVDVAFYGVGLNTDKFFCSIGVAEQAVTCRRSIPPSISPGAIFQDFINLCLANMLFSGVGLILGYWATFSVIDRWGRKKVQLMGFAVLTVLFLVIGFVLPRAVPPEVTDNQSSSLFTKSAGSSAMLFLFCLAGFFLNFGPNTTTFIMPGEHFPTRYRSTCHGLSAASGKLGAIMSQFAIVQPLSTANALKVFAPFTATGLLATLFIPETNQLTLEELSNEQQEGFIRGLAPQGSRPS